MAVRHDTIVIGGGQAGLAMSASIFNSTSAGAVLHPFAASISWGFTGCTLLVRACFHM
jgi:hypothetical protein